MENNETTMNVFITGGSDAVGREVIRQLSSKGSRVTALIPRSDGAQAIREIGGIAAFGDPLRAGELRSLMHAAEADVVMHLGTQAYNTVPLRSTNWDEAADFITRSTVAFLEAAQAKGVKFAVYASYAFVYGDTHGEWVDESAPRLKPSRYGNHPALRAALAAEDAVLTSGVPACILRPGFVYGAHGDAHITVRDALRHGKPLVVNDGHQVANWVFAGDLASAAIRAAQQQPGGEIFNIADDHPTSPAEFVDYFASASGVGKAVRLPSSRIPGLPARNVNAMQRILWDMSLRVKNDKAKAQLGWSPRYPSYREGVEQALLTWRAGVER